MNHSNELIALSRFPAKPTEVRVLAVGSPREPRDSSVLVASLTVGETTGVASARCHIEVGRDICVYIYIGETPVEAP